MSGPCGVIAVNGLVGAMQEHFSGWAVPNFKPSVPNAKTAIMALNWTFMMVGKGVDSNR